MKKSVIRSAVFPVAGLGTRFLPATKASAKEMLPIVDKPLIQYAVEEAYEAGIRHMIFVTGRSKRSIEDHFDTAYELENELRLSGKLELLKYTQGIVPKDMICSYVRQASPQGLGHAVLCAKQMVGNEPFAVLLADDLFVGKPNALVQMIQQFEELRSSIIAVESIPKQHANRYGIVEGAEAGSNLLALKGIVEKPKPEDAPSTLAVAGRYILTHHIFEELEGLIRSVGDEIQLTDGIAKLLVREKVYAFKFEGKRYDCGSKLGFLQATVELAEQHPELGSEFSKWLHDRC